MDYMDYAVQYLQEHGCTCAAFDGKVLLSSFKRGVAPLLQWLEEGQSLQGFCVADKVIGKGAAFLYLQLKAERVHAQVISRPSLILLEEHGVKVTYDSCVPAIRNRDNTGFCPIESAVLDCSDPTDAIERIKIRLKELKK